MNSTDICEGVLDFIAWAKRLWAVDRREGGRRWKRHRSGLGGPDRISCDGSARLVVHPLDQQLVGVALVVDAEWRDGPTSHESAGGEPRDGAVEFLGPQPLDAARDLSIEIRGGGRIAFVEVGDRLDDLGDRLFDKGDLQRPRAASMISRARLASMTRP